jgi:hypothetical protein
MPIVNEAAYGPEAVGTDRNAVATALGTRGAFVLTWVGGGRVHVRRYDVDARPVDAAPTSYAAGTWVRTAALGWSGGFVVVNRDGQSVCVHQFAADGSTRGHPSVTVDGFLPGGSDNWPELSAIGRQGECVRWQMLDHAEDAANGLLHRGGETAAHPIELPSTAPAALRTPAMAPAMAGVRALPARSTTARSGAPNCRMI